MSSLLTDPADKSHKKSFHRRNDSDELDVFEASRYFSGYNNEAPTMVTMKEERPSRRGGRISLDMPIRNVLDQQLHHHHHHHHQHHAVDHQNKQNLQGEKIKYKQPSSPGGRLASFLNSLFNQSNSKKKKSKSTTTQSMKDEEESPGGRRRRRSSISHFRSWSTTTATTTATDAKSKYSSSSSGFRTPPPYITTTKHYKDFKTYSDHKSKLSIMSHAKPTVLDENVVMSSNRELNWLDEKFKYKSSTDQDHSKGLLKRLSEVVGVEDDDDGADSDSSSDLFELQNYDLGYYSGSLPVYETTNVDSIRNIRGTPISNAS